MKTAESKYPQKSGFKAPQNYFESFEDRLMAKLSEVKSIEIPSKVEVYKVPDSYFESIEAKVLDKIQDEPKVVSLFRKEYLYYAAAIAAVFVLMLGNFFEQANEQPIGWDDIEISAMENYIDEGYDMGFIELNSNEVSDFVFKNGNLITDSDFDDVNSDAVFEYIDENIEDPAYILE